MSEMTQALMERDTGFEVERRKNSLTRRCSDRRKALPLQESKSYPKRYPTTFIDIWHLRDGRRVTFRPILPQDAPLLAELVARASTSTKRNRFHGAVNGLTSGAQAYLSCVDFSNHVAFVITTEFDGNEQVIAEARYVIEKSDEPRSAEFALLIDDHWQRCGLGERAMRALMESASQSGLRWLHGSVLAQNLPMLGLMKKCGFCCTPDRNDESMVKVESVLDGFRVNRMSSKTGRLGSNIFTKLCRYLPWQGSLVQSSRQQNMYERKP